MFGLYGTLATMTALPAQIAAKEDRVRTVGEVDVWWGSYAGRAMAPSFAVCMGLTILIYCGVRWWVPERGWMQLTFFGLAGALWLVQLARWSYRFFTWNYRLTTRFLYVDRGLKKLLALRVPVATIDRVDVRKDWLEEKLGIGSVWIWPDTQAAEPIILNALRTPRKVAETIRDIAKNARMKQQAEPEQ